jgi:replicative DNA helicase
MRANKKPNLNDLRLSKPGIIKEADLIMLLYMESYYKMDSKAPAELIIAKNTNRNTGVVRLDYDINIRSFDSLSLSAQRK